MTFLVGQQGTGWTLGEQGVGSGGDAIAYKSGYLATAGTATTAYVHITDPVTSSFVKVFIYDQGGNLVGQSNAITSSTGLQSASLTASVALTAQTYTLVVQPNSGYVGLGRNSAGANFQCNQWLDSGASAPQEENFVYAIPPSTLPTPYVTDSGYEFIVWLDGTEGSPTVKKLKLLAHSRRRNAA
jgi:hypothetical protein